MSATPGPWRLAHDHSPVNGWMRYLVREIDDTDDYALVPESVATQAALAPELVNALRDALTWVECSRDNTAHANIAEQAQEFIDSARALLARLEGKS